MAKTKETLRLEKLLLNTFKNKNSFGCLEVTIGYYGKERVDGLSYDYKDIFRAYEIKVSKQDFYSKCHNSFIGNYNYYVMPRELYEQVKNDIPLEVGVLCEGNMRWNQDELITLKQPKRQSLKVEKDILKNSLIRSLSREFSNYLYLMKDIEYIKDKKVNLKENEQLKKLVNDLQQDIDYYRSEFRKRKYEVSK